MKTKLFAPIVAGCLAAACTLFVPGLRAQGPQGFNIGGGQGFGNSTGVIAIKNISINTPNTPQYTTIGGEEKRSQIQKWLEVEVEFSSTAPVTPEVAFKYYILVAGSLLVGEVTHVDVPAGQSLFSVMYVTPRTLATYLKGQPLNNATVQNIDVQVIRPGVAQPLSEKMLKQGPAFYNTLQQIPGLVLNKDQTPFAFLYWDRYEAIKKPRAAGL